MEFDASNRDFEFIEDQIILSRQEVQSSQKVLNAAALTYVAAALSTVLTILRFVILYMIQEEEIKLCYLAGL